MTDGTESSRGTLGIGKDGAFQIQFERQLPKAPRESWLWLTDPEKLSKWLPGCQINASKDGAVLFDFGEEGQATGKVVALAAPDEDGGFLEHTWHWEGVAPDSLVRWELSPVDGGTKLTLVHREVIEEPAREFAMGWHMILDALQFDASGLSSDEAWNMSEDTAAYYLGS